MKLAGAYITVPHMESTDDTTYNLKIWEGT